MKPSLDISTVGADEDVSTIGADEDISTVGAEEEVSSTKSATGCVGEASGLSLVVSVLVSVVVVVVVVVVTCVKLLSGQSVTHAAQDRIVRISVCSTVRVTTLFCSTMLGLPVGPSPGTASGALPMKTGSWGERPMRPAELPSAVLVTVNS